jgi:hypothetical protein
MADWPSTLPQHFNKQSYRETAPDLVVTFKTDIGPPMTRKRAAANIREFSGEMVISISEKATLDEFWEDNCSVPFNFPDQWDGNLKPTIFMGRPEYAGHEGLFITVNFKMAQVP